MRDPRMQANVAPRKPCALCRSIPLAEHLLKRLHLWLASPAAQMHSPTLLALVNTALAKTFLQLLAEVRALDATIVAASTASLVISTRKHAPAAAAAYVNFLVNTISARELFKWVALEPARAWHTLLWRDCFNYAGVALGPQMLALMAPPVGDTSGAAAAAAAAAAGSEAAYEAEWALRNFLPPAVHKYFDDIVQRFVMRPWQAVQDGLSQSGSVRCLMFRMGARACIVCHN